MSLNQTISQEPNLCESSLSVVKTVNIEEFIVIDYAVKYFGNSFEILIQSDKQELAANQEREDEKRKMDFGLTVFL